MVQQEKGWNSGAKPTSPNDHIISVSTRRTTFTKELFILSKRVSENQRIAEKGPEHVNCQTQLMMSLETWLLAAHRHKDAQPHAWQTPNVFLNTIIVQPVVSDQEVG